MCTCETCGTLSLLCATPKVSFTAGRSVALCRYLGTTCGSLLREPARGLILFQHSESKVRAGRRRQNISSGEPTQNLPCSREMPGSNSGPSSTTRPQGSPLQYLSRLYSGLSDGSAADMDISDFEQYDGIGRLYAQKDTNPPSRDGYDAVRCGYCRSSIGVAELDP